MKIIVPMAGMGKRMRPHTLTIPKPLIPIAGKPIVQRLVEDIAKVCSEPIEEVSFIIKDTFGQDVESELKAIAESLGAKGTICYQGEALGTAHAILCAKESLSGPVVIAFADTLFVADFTLESEKDGIIWVKRVDDPSQFGVVKITDQDVITDFHEKPTEFISDLAIIGIYYVKEAEKLRDEMQYLVDNDIREKGEYQLTNALEALKSKGLKFVTGAVDEWLDCGNKNATVYTNQRVLEQLKKEPLIRNGVSVSGSVIHEPCYIEPGVMIENSIVGPYVSISRNTKITSSVVDNSIIQSDTEILNANISNSMVGNSAKISGRKFDLSVGDFNTCEL